MSKYNTQYKIAVQIFTEIYGYIPNNFKKESETANLFFTIQKMLHRIFPTFFDLWHDFYPNVNLEEDFNFKLDSKLAELLKIEITYRHHNSQGRNNQRTRVIKYINEKFYEKISAEALRYFFLPYFHHYKSLNLQYFEDFEKRFSNFIIFYELVNFSSPKLSYIFEDLKKFFSCLYSHGTLPTTDYATKVNFLLNK